MNAPKIQLSPEEMQLVKNSEWILTKQRIIEKVYDMFGGLSEAMHGMVQQRSQLLPPEARAGAPKISRGEQYRRLPWVVLDYPRFFSKNDVLAIRVFFWWANYFSITLHLKGRFIQDVAQRLREISGRPEFAGYYISYAGDEFSFDLSGEDYGSVESYLPRINAIEEGLFFKIGCKVPLECWDTASTQLLAAFEKLLMVVAEPNCQSGAAGPSPGSPKADSGL